MQHPIKSTDVFGVYDAMHDGEIYQVSRTGIVVYPTKRGRKLHKDAKPQVISMVNGSMCINPLGDFICAANFDEYLLEWIDYNKYRLSKPGEAGLAYFDPATNTYTTTEPAWHTSAFPIGASRRSPA